MMKLSKMLRIVIGSCIAAVGLAAAAPAREEGGATEADSKKEVDTMLKIGVPEGADAKAPRDAAAQGLPKVLLIGDSISGGYLGGVKTHLKGVAHVERGMSGGTTIQGLEIIEKILGDTEWDVIHFNWRLHDMT